MSTKKTYKVIFYNHEDIYEIFATHVYPSEMYGFVEVEQLLFGEKSQLLVDPSEEKLKSEFGGVKRTYIPMHAVVRIDEVDKQGASKISSIDGDNVSQFPMPVYTPGGQGGPGGDS